MVCVPTTVRVCSLVCPCLCVCSRACGNQSVKRLAVAVGRTRAFTAAEIGTRVQALETAAVVKEIASRLRVESPSDVHLVQIKGAITSATPAAAAAARKSGTPLRNDMVRWKLALECRGLCRGLCRLGLGCTVKGSLFARAFNVCAHVCLCV